VFNSLSRLTSISKVYHLDTRSKIGFDGRDCGLSEFSILAYVIGNYQTRYVANYSDECFIEGLSLWAGLAAIF